MPALFGTDGIRGRAYRPPLDEDTVRRLGAALAAELGAAGGPPLLLAGDTRASTPDLARWLAGAYQAAGGTVEWAGVLPTPAVSHLVRRGSWIAGVVISASHNPAPDNGIKVLAASGEKIPDSLEERLEARMETAEPLAGPPLPEPSEALADRYLELLHATHGRACPLDGLHVVVDCANGAASAMAAPFLEDLGARVTVLHARPDGTNINEGCGATVPGQVAEAVVRAGAHAGLALDGDADRAILVDEKGGVLDGDDILLAWARHLAAGGRLPGSTVVATVMSNFGLERALAAHGIETLRCPVGDRAVWETMRSSGSALGGEQSGHVICSHHGVTGDGLLTGTHLLAVAAASGRPLSELSDLVRLPQVLLNVPVRHKPPFEEQPAIHRWAQATRERLAGRGRLVLRYSGTEPKARIMIEGDDPAEIETLAREGAELIARELG